MVEVGPCGGDHILLTDGEDLVQRVPANLAGKVLQLRDSGLLDSITAAGHMLPSEVSVGDDPAYPVTIRTRLLKTLTYPFEWSPRMLQDAASMVLDLEGLLRERGYTLADPFAWNVSFDGTRPVYLDFGCIGPDPGGAWGGHDLFLRYFLYPLELHAAGLHRVARALLADYWEGVRREEVHYFSQWGGGRSFVPRPVRRAVKEGLRRTGVMRRTRAVGTADSLRSLRKQLASLDLDKTSYWSGYQDEKAADPLWAEKIEAVRRIVDTCHPGSVTDLGGNTGELAMAVAADLGIPCVVTDRDDACVDAAYLAAKSKGLPITPVVMDIRQPADAVTLARGSLRSAYDRFECDLVLALALLHHLVGTGFGQVSMEQAIVMLGRFARRHLAVEFVPRGDPWWPKSGSPPDWWSIEHLRAVLRKLGWQVKVELESHPPGRTILVGERERIET